MPRNFNQLIRLIQTAEPLLIRAGQSDPLTRLTTLRGIYYGTSWSLDYAVERSSVRNWGFWVFTGLQDPVDPRPILGEQLFRELQQCQDVVNGINRLDFGHLLIGLDARKRSIGRSVAIPNMGGTGLELVTWLGDLGGGTANLAYRRLTNPNLSVQYIFDDRGSDYGASINLEGDIAGYLVASNQSIPDQPTFSSGSTISDALVRYLPLQNTTTWNTRATRFTSGIGGIVNGMTLTNRSAFIAGIRNKIQDFAAYYLWQRYIISGRLVSADILRVCTILSGVAEEVATTFVNALTFSMANPARPISGRPPFPPISRPTSQCNITLLNMAARAKNASSLIDELEQLTRDSLGRLFD